MTALRVERLQAITEADAVAEGLEADADGGTGAAAAYARLWASLHGAESWQGNPWVWVTEFERVA